jgi:hypothetical protein
MEVFEEVLLGFEQRKDLNIGRLLRNLMTFF